jgi:chlorite dismutase
MSEEETLPETTASEAPAAAAKRPTLSLFAPFTANAAFWALDGCERRRVVTALRDDLVATCESAACYQLYPTRGPADGGDLLAWVSAEAAEPGAVDAAFRAFARATAPHRRWFEPGETLWGLTRPSPYVGRESSTTIDPTTGDDGRLPYLVVYPFVKTHGWYRLELDDRRRLMGEHIRVGRQYGDVDQLLLYAFGLQDQDFVVVYECADLARFSALVHDLRATEARGYTARDTPIVTALHRPGDALPDLFA